MSYENPIDVPTSRIPNGWRQAVDSDFESTKKRVIYKHQTNEPMSRWVTSIYESLAAVSHSNRVNHKYIVRIDEDDAPRKLPSNHYCKVDNEEDYKAFREMFPGEKKWYNRDLPDKFICGTCYFRLSSCNIEGLRDLSEGAILREHSLARIYLPTQRVELPSDARSAASSVNSVNPQCSPTLLNFRDSVSVYADQYRELCFRKYSPSITINPSDLTGDPEVDKAQFKKLLQEVLQEEKIEAAPSKPGFIRRSSGFAAGCAWKLVKYCMGPSKAWIQNLAFLASVCGIGYAGYNYGPPAYNWAKSWIPSVKVSFEESSPSESVTRVD